jgi:hypothetical protein
MTSLEQKQKRILFLKYLESKGIESVSAEIERNEREVKFILHLEKVRMRRDKRIDYLLNDKVPSYDKVDFIGKQFFYLDKGSDEIFFYCNDGKIYQMYHEQEYCESVYIDGVEGDINDLINSEILNVELVIKPMKVSYGTATLTFYKFTTQKGTVTIKWFGNSTGSYSESIDIRTFDSKDIWRDTRLEVLGIN